GDVEALGDLADLGDALGGRALLVGDTDDFEPVGAILLLEFQQVGDRVDAVAAPGAPEVDEDEGGVEVAEVDGPAMEVGQAEVDQTLLAGVEPASGLAVIDDPGGDPGSGRGRGRRRGRGGLCQARASDRDGGVAGWRGG